MHISLRCTDIPIFQQWMSRYKHQAKHMTHKRFLFWALGLLELHNQKKLYRNAVRQQIVDKQNNYSSNNDNDTGVDNN